LSDEAVAGRRFRKNGFTLVEVVLAMGVFVFAVLSVVGVMATGLDSVSTSNNNFAVANMTRSLRANFGSMNYTNVVSQGATQTLATNYFSNSGYATNTNDPVYYTVVCSSAATSQFATSLMSSTNAAVIAVNIIYPYPANVKTNTFALFLAQ